MARQGVITLLNRVVPNSTTRQILKAVPTVGGYVEYFTVKNWKKFQHYKDRNPPWIKLHFEMLSSADWVMLDDTSRMLAIASMLIASRNEGRVPNNPDYVKRVAYLNKLPNFKPLIDCGFFEKPLANDSKSKQIIADARPETETYREEAYSKKEDKKNKDSKNFVLPLPDWLPLEDWNDYLEMRQSIKKPATNKAKQLVIVKLHTLLLAGYSVSEILQQSTINNWQSVFATKKDFNNGKQNNQLTKTERRNIALAGGFADNQGQSGRSEPINVTPKHVL